MYAVIRTGGKQYKVSDGDLIKIEKLDGEAGSEVVFSEVLALGETIGSPLVSGASVKGEIVKQAKDEKVIVFKKKRRHNYRRKKGHRQEITLVKIIDITGKAASKPAKAPKAEVASEAVVEKAAKPAKAAKETKSAAKEPKKAAAKPAKATAAKSKTAKK